MQAATGLHPKNVDGFTQKSDYPILDPWENTMKDDVP